MIFLIFISYGGAVLMGIALFLIGHLLLKLHITTIQITKGGADKDPSEIQESTIDPDVSHTDSVTDNHQWQPYTINLQFGDTLTLLGWLLKIIGLISIISSIVGFAIVTEMDSPYNIKLP